MARKKSNGNGNGNGNDSVELILEKNFITKLDTNLYGKKVKIKCKNQNQKEFIKLIDEKEIILCSGPAGCGKAQPLYSTIYTPNGPIKMRDVKIGQDICGVNGDVIKINGIYPQGLKDCYRVYFTDGVYVDCCDEHLWSVSTNKNRDYGKYDVYDIIQTKNMLNNIYARDNRRNYKLPITKPVFYKKTQLPFDSYLMGVLIGDGSMTQRTTRITSNDKQIINEVSNIVKNYKLKLVPTKKTLLNEDCTYIISGKKNNPNYITNEIDKLKIRCKCEHKFIPNEYLYSSIEDRIKLLQGLMDTDGTVRKKSGCPMYSTSSYQLKDNFCELIRSLGGIATVSIKKTNKLDNYVININLPNNIKPFKLKRKLNLLKEKTKYLTPRFIDKIEYIGKIEQQCISVNSNEHLYLTDNHVVTHNSHLSIAKALEYIQTPDNGYNIIYIITPAVEAEEKLGSLPGNLDQKLEPYLFSTYYLIDKIIGKETREKLVDNGIIQPLALGFLRGVNIDNAILVFEEAQNSSHKQMKTLLTRIGYNSKFIISGDIKQIDRFESYEKSGLLDAMERFKNFEEIGKFNFCDGDSVRNDIINKLLKYY
ncbi:MAG: PhoH family protein [Saccharofermentanales bacterium]